MTTIMPSKEELVAFHATHFSLTSTNHFAAQFLGPVENAYTEGDYSEAAYYQEDYAEEEDDGLGYYPDGVKRTLTDEQIAIFRHSEIQALLRERKHAEEAQEDKMVEVPDEGALTFPVQKPAHELIRPIIGPVMEQPDMEDGELQDDTTEIYAPTPASDTTSGLKKSRKKKKKPSNASASQWDREPKPKGFFKQNVKPDLRKRTWDVVDKGLEQLVYDEMDGEAATRPSTVKRRQISYDD